MSRGEGGEKYSSVQDRTKVRLPGANYITLHYFTYVCLHTCDFCARQRRHRPLPVFERGGCNLSAFARADGRTGNGSGEDVCGMRVLRETWTACLHVCVYVVVVRGRVLLVQYDTHSPVECVRACR